MQRRRILIAPSADDKLPHPIGGVFTVTETPKSPEPAPVAGTEIPRLRFIPFRRSELLHLLGEAPEGAAGHDDERADPAGAAFAEAAQRIEEAFAGEFHAERQALKDAYAPLDPDADTRRIDTHRTGRQGDDLAERLSRLLNRANYERFTEKDLKRAFRSASLFQIRLRVDMRDFDEALLFGRWTSIREESLPVLGGLLGRTVKFTNYDRVVLYLRFADRGAKGDPDLVPGSVMIKLFQNVPEADLEMLFPNTRVTMRWIDRALIGVPAVASGALVAFTKLGAPLVLLGALFGFWLGLRSEPVTLDRQGLLVIGAGLAAVGAYVWKQFSSYRNRKARFRQALTRNLYFKLLDNNAGVLLRVLDDAEDSECKEAWVAIRFLLEAPAGLTAADLDARIETWFRDTLGAELDFEIDDALHKLERLGLAVQSDGRWSACPGAAVDVPEPEGTQAE
jgi:hypothetical protein